MHCILCKPVWFNITQASYYTVSEELVGQPQPHVTSWKLQRELLLFLLNPSTDTLFTARSCPGLRAQQEAAGGSICPALHHPLAYTSSTPRCCINTRSLPPVR